MRGDAGREMRIGTKAVRLGRLSQGGETVSLVRVTISHWLGSWTFGQCDDKLVRKTSLVRKTIILVRKTISLAKKTILVGKAVSLIQGGDTLGDKDDKFDKEDDNFSYVDDAFGQEDEILTGKKISLAKNTILVGKAVSLFQ